MTELLVDKLRISVTDRCILRCVYCMPRDGVPLVSHGEILRYEEMAVLVKALVEEAGLKRVRLTGGEPLIRHDLDDCVAMLKATGVEEVALTTNGHLLPRMAQALADAGLARVNISLDSIRPDTYARLSSGGAVEKVMAGVEAAKAAGLTPIKINAVVLRGYNEDQLAELVRYADEAGGQMRFLEAMAIGQLADNHRDHFVPLAEMVETLSRDFEVILSPQPAGETAKPATLRDRKTGRETAVGFIASESIPFCRTCRRLRLTASGRLLACLLSDAGEELRDWVRSPEPRDRQEFRDRVARTLACKPSLRRKTNTEFMSRIGG